MTRTVGFVVLAGRCVSGCFDAARLNDRCEWTHDPAGAADEAHLTDDATVAEELAIRFADARRAYRHTRRMSGQPIGHCGQT